MLRVVLSGIPLYQFSGTSDFLRLFLKSTNSYYAWCPTLSRLTDFKRAFAYLYYTLVNHGVVTFLAQISSFICAFLLFCFRFPFVSVTLVHPQSVGYRNLLRLCKVNKITYSYIVDTSWFCIKSYNYISPELSPCFRCLISSDSSLVNGCSCLWDNSFDSHHLYIQGLHRGLFGHLFVQNKAQYDLFLASGFSSSHISILPMVSESVLVEIYSQSPLRPDKVGDLQSFDFHSRYSVVFHGSEVLAKGLEFALKCASLNPDITFFFPFSSDSILPSFRTSNMIFFPSSWNTGLRELCYNCSAILIPSLWSAPIESSLLKSLSTSKPVISLKFDSYDSSFDFSSVNYFYPQDILRPRYLTFLLDNSLLRVSDKSELFDFASHSLSSYINL